MKIYTLRPDTFTLNFLRMIFLKVILDEDGGRAIAVFERIGKGAGGDAKAARPGMHKVKATRQGGWVDRQVDGVCVCVCVREK